jgi:ATP-dependent RNA helicase DHX29
MGRKQKGGGSTKPDARGYQQGQVAAKNRPSMAATVSTFYNTTTSKTASASATKNIKGDRILSITPSIHRDLEDLLQTLRIDDDGDRPKARVDPSICVGPSDRFTKRMSNIYYRLKELGFAYEQIHLVVVKLGYTISLEGALDWLCVHLKTEQLPALFTEGQVRDFLNVEETHQAKPSLTVLTPAIFGVDHQGKSEAHSSGLFTGPILSRAESEAGFDDLVEAIAAQKAWLVQQYQYEQDGDEEVAGEEVESYDRGVSADATVAEGPHNKDVLSQSMSFDQEQLVQLKAELQEIDADLRDEAGNYMRSKHEIKEMQKKAGQLRKNIKSWERKVQKRTRDSSIQGQSDGLLLQPADPEAEMISDGVLGALYEDMLGESEEASTDAGSPKQSRHDEVVARNNPALFIPKGTIPRTWTGKTPKIILEEWCRKEKLPRPSFLKTHGNGCLLRWKLDRENTMEIDQPGSAGDRSDAQHYAATRALYRINPNLPLYRILPPFYRDVWVQWANADKERKGAAGRELDDANRADIEKLIRAIPVTVAAPVTSTDEHAAHTASIEEASECWDTNDQHESPVSAIARVTETREDRRLQEDFLKRQKCSMYKEMLDARKALPVFAFREQILECIEKNPVTIISAETGAGKTTRTLLVRQPQLRRSDIIVSILTSLLSCLEVPQFILTQALEEQRGSKVSIICTQPRRVAATSVAERVSEELAENSIGGVVGYQIRLEAKRSNATKLLFCTTGVVLRRLAADPVLSGVTHVVVDEVHERQWQIDLVLVSLRILLRGSRPDLKIILVSTSPRWIIDT